MDPIKLFMGKSGGYWTRFPIPRVINGKQFYNSKWRNLGFDQ